MATRPLSPRLRCDALESRVTPATILDLGTPDTPGPLLLTDGPFQARAAWAPTPVDVRAFHTSFVFRQDGEPAQKGDGFTFALTGTPDQPAGRAGGGLGYAGLTDSVAIKFDLVDNAGEGVNSVGLYTGGADPTPRPSDWMRRRSTCRAGTRSGPTSPTTGPILTLTLTDMTAPDQPWTHQFPVNIPAAVGSPTGYVGFTAGTGALFAEQAIDSWTFASDTPPSRPPVIADPAGVAPVSLLSVALIVGATDDGGPANLTYTWEIVSAPPGAASHISPRPGDPTAAIAGFDTPGHYQFRVTVRDANGQTAVSEVGYNFPTFVGILDVSPASATVPAGGMVRFTAVVRNQFHLAVPGLAASWQVVSGPGTIDPFGRYTAPADATGTATVRAALGGTVTEATVTITPAVGIDFVAGFDGREPCQQRVGAGGRRPAAAGRRPVPGRQRVTPRARWTSAGSPPRSGSRSGTPRRGGTGTG